MRDYTEEELKMLSDVLPNIALQLRTSLSTIYMAVDRMAPIITHFNSIPLITHSLE